MRSGGATYKKRTESTTVTACLNYLKLLENQKLISWVDRLNSGKIFIPGARSRMIRLCREGTPDIYMLTKQGLFVFIECKHGENVQSLAQREFQNVIESSGHKYWLIYDVNELMIRVKTLLESA